MERESSGLFQQQYSKALFATTLWKVPVGGGPATNVLDNLSTQHSFAIVDSGIYFVPGRIESPGSSIRFLSFANNQIRTVASFATPLDSAESGGLAVSPDGRWLLFTQFEQNGSELMLVENFDSR